MRVYLSEVTEQGRDFAFNHPEHPWLMETIRRLDESDPNPTPRPPAVEAQREKQRSATATFEVRRLDNVYAVEGKIDTTIQLLCSRSGEPFLFESHPRFTALYTKDKSMAGMSENQPSHDANGSALSRSKGFAHNGRGEEINYDMEITFVEKEYIDLSEILEEQLQLEIPVQPISDAYKDKPVDTKSVGDASPWKENAFSSLKSFKVKRKQ